MVATMAVTIHSTPNITAYVSPVVKEWTVDMDYFQQDTVLKWKEQVVSFIF